MSATPLTLLAGFEAALRSWGQPHPLVDAALDAVDKFRKSPGVTDGATVQAFVDAASPHLVGFLPPGWQYAALIQQFWAAVEPFIGVAIDKVEQVVADAQPTLPDTSPSQPLPDNLGEAPVEGQVPFDVQPTEVP